LNSETHKLHIFKEVRTQQNNNKKGSKKKKWLHETK
jgi:hypothetical protein